MYQSTIDRALDGETTPRRAPRRVTFYSPSQQPSTSDTVCITILIGKLETPSYVVIDANAFFDGMLSFLKEMADQKDRKFNSLHSDYRELQEEYHEFCRSSRTSPSP
jgi:hypothetical protein